MGFRGGGGGGGLLAAAAVEADDEELAVAVYGGGGATCECSEGGGGGAFLYPEEILLEGGGPGLSPETPGLFVAVVLERLRELPPFCVRDAWTNRAKKCYPLTCPKCENATYRRILCV